MVALGIQGDEGVSLMEVKLVQLVNAELLPPLDVLRPKFLGTWDVVLPRTAGISVAYRCPRTLAWSMILGP